MRTTNLEYLFCCNNRTLFFSSVESSVLTRTKVALATPSLTSFVTPLALGTRTTADTDSTSSSTNPVISEQAELPCALAIEYLADAAAEQARPSPETAASSGVDAPDSNLKKDEAVAVSL